MKRSPLLVIFITVLIDLIGFGIVIPVLPFYLESPQFNATPAALGWLLASYSMMQLIFTPVLGRLSDKYGRRPVLLLSLIGTGIGFLILGLANTLWMLFAGRILDGITGGNISTAQAYVADVTTPENRAKGMGLVGAAFGLGFIIGPAVGGTLSQWGISVPFLFAAGLAFANAVLLYFVLPETVTVGHAARPVARGWARTFSKLADARFSFVLMIYFLFIVAFSMMTTTFAFYTMYRFNYNARDNGYLFAFIGLIAAVLQGGLIGRLVKRFGEWPFIVLGGALMAAGLFALPFVGPQAGGLLGLLAVLALLANGNAMTTPTLTSLSSKSAAGHEQGLVLGLTQSLSSLARIIGPVLGGYLVAANATAAQRVNDASIRLTFWVASVITFVAFLLAIYSSRRRVNQEVPGAELDDVKLEVSR